MKFKTNAKCGGCTAAILRALAPIAPASDWEFDLSVSEKTLTYLGSAELSAAEVAEAIRGAGFSAEPLD